MRGKVKVCETYDSGTGITPAYAGKSLTGTVWTRPPRDHPRLCGEKVFFGIFQFLCAGSPPPMRGKAFHTKNPLLLIRITPAYAGKSQGSAVVTDFIEDHPRLCGEKMLHRQQLPQYLGSPPPMRGKAENACVTDTGNRITPAYAGKSPRGSRFQLRAGGSPPPMRGKGGGSASAAPRRRITPAYAGKRVISESYTPKD